MSTILAKSFNQKNSPVLLENNWKTIMLTCSGSKCHWRRSSTSSLSFVLVIRRQQFYMRWTNLTRLSQLADKQLVYLQSFLGKTHALEFRFYSVSSRNKQAILKVIV